VAVRVRPVELFVVAPPPPLVRRVDVSVPAVSIGKSDAPATRTWASAWFTRSVAMARSGLPASASSTSDCSSGDPKLSHHVGDTTAALAGAPSFHVPATGTYGLIGGLVTAQPMSDSATATAIDRRKRSVIM